MQASEAAREGAAAQLLQPGVSGVVRQGLLSHRLPAGRHSKAWRANRGCWPLPPVKQRRSQGVGRYLARARQAAALSMRRYLTTTALRFETLLAGLCRDAPQYAE